MLVTGLTRAYLVSWSCNNANIFTIDVNYVWLREALLLLITVQQQYLSHRQVPPEAFYKGKSAKHLRQLTKEALSLAKAQPPVSAIAVQNMQADNKYIMC